MPFNTRAVPQLLDNIKEAKEVLAASLARGKADPVAESLEQKASEAKTGEQETKAEKPKPQVGRPRPLRNQTTHAPLACESLYTQASRL